MNRVKQVRNVCRKDLNLCSDDVDMLYEKTNVVDVTNSNLAQCERELANKRQLGAYY
jgi:hypothetical protein